jgi:hypothetical protein
VGNIFPTRPYIYRFIELLRVGHAFQRFKAKETFVRIRKQRKISEKIYAQLTRLLEQHTKGEISNLQFSLSCDKAVKTKLIKTSKLLISRQLETS